MSPATIVGMKALYRCKSEPQIAVDEILTIASRWLMICGSGTSCTETLVLPIQQFALIIGPSFVTRCDPRAGQDAVRSIRYRRLSRLKQRLRQLRAPVSIDADRL